MEEISDKELEERVALLKKFRALLQRQRDKFREYLEVLEKQENSIANEDADALLAHTELEQQVVSNIMNLQKVIVPMSDLYKARGGDQKEETIASLQSDLSALQNQVLAQNKRNRDLLRSHIDSIRTQIASFRNPYKSRRSIYAEKSGAGNLVAVEA